MNGHRKSDLIDRELRKLVERSLVERLTEEEVAQLEAGLKQNQEARRFFLRHSQLEADLANAYRSERTLRRAWEEAEEEHPKQNSRLASIARYLSVDSGQLKAMLPYAAAAMLIGVLAGGAITMSFVRTLDTERVTNLASNMPLTIDHPQQRNYGSVDEYVATMGATHEVQWQMSEAPSTLPSRGIRQGQQIRLESGIVKLRFGTGAQVLLEGPAVFEALARDRGKLYLGKMTADSGIGRPFVVQTACGNFELRSGRARLQSDLTGESKVDVLQGETRVTRIGKRQKGLPSQHHLLAGNSLHFGSDGKAGVFGTVDSDETRLWFPPRGRAAFEGNIIWLSNLFDDGTTATLTEAMATDSFQAAAETIDLGVAAVRDGGLDVDFMVAAEGIKLNLANVGGGGPATNGLPANDTFRSISPVGIRTTGIAFDIEDPVWHRKIEDGIGMSANEMLTFDLEEIRAAGQLGDANMRFVVDRAGISDSVPHIGDARFVVVVSTHNQVISSHINGHEEPLTKSGGVYRFADTKGPKFRELKTDGKYVSFDVDLPLEARYLTLATTMGYTTSCDHSVFSGARLEVERLPEMAAIEEGAPQPFAVTDEPAAITPAMVNRRQRTTASSPMPTFQSPSTM